MDDHGYSCQFPLFLTNHIYLLACILRHNNNILSKLAAIHPTIRRLVLYKKCEEIQYSSWIRGFVHVDLLSFVDLWFPVHYAVVCLACASGQEKNLNGKGCKRWNISRF